MKRHSKPSQILSALLTLVFVSGCASIHEGNYAEPESGVAKNHRESSSGIIISGRENRELTSTYVDEVDFTFENDTPNWIHIQNVTLDFGSKDSNAAIKMPVGRDLIAWAKAAEQNKEIRDANTEMLLGSVLALGTAASLARTDSTLATLGAATALTAAGGLGVETFKNEKQKVEMAKLVPDSHLLSDDFVIPPGLHAKKWVALYSKAMDPRVDSVTITYTIAGGKTEKAHLKFRNSTLSNWQAID